jgi:radical SAM protein with 4Fe4S-binding SPASM domain
MSFAKDDADYLINNWDAVQNPDGCSRIDEDVRDFFLQKIALINSRKIRSPLLDLGMTFSFPTIVNIELNRRCSLSCKHCYIPITELKSQSKSFFENLSNQKIETLLDSISEMGVFLIVLTGGEAFLNQRLPFFLEETSKRNFIVEIFSNLQALPNWFEELNPYQRKIGRIQTSVYSVFPEIHDQIVQRKGAFQNTLKNLLKLRDKGYYVEVATPLMSLNFDSRHETEKFFIELDIRQSFAWPIVNEYYDPSLKSKSSLNITKEQFLEFCLEKPDYLFKIDPSENSENSICAAGQSLFSISADGSVFPCSQYPRVIGNITSSDLKQIFNSPEMDSIRNSKLSDIPADSFMYNYCMGNNFSETGNPFKQEEFIRDLLAYYDKYVDQATKSVV